MLNRARKQKKPSVAVSTSSKKPAQKEYVSVSLRSKNDRIITPKDINIVGVLKQ